jgi:hypothetical protein
MAQSRSGGSRSGSKPGSKSGPKTGRKTTTSASSKATTRKAAAKKGGQASARTQKAKKAASGTAKAAASGARGAGVEAKTVAEIRNALRKNLIRPLEMVMLSRDRIEEVLGEAVDQGRVTTRDAQRIATGLVKRGEQQTKDVLGDLEKLLGRGRRAAGVGPSFPIAGYDDLNATEIQKRLAGLSPPELRKVRDHERRNANRKTILNAIESKLS